MSVVNREWCGPVSRLSSTTVICTICRYCAGSLTAVVVVLALITAHFAIADANSRPIILPIEVLGDDGETVSTTVELQPRQAEAVHSLWVRTNGLVYSTQGSVQVNAGQWVPLQNETVAVDEPGRSYGGIGGGFATLSMKVLLHDNTAVAGANTIRFRFNHTDGVSSGYRVLAFNFLDADGMKLLAPEQFADDNPDAWSPPLQDPSAIQSGRELWQSAELTQSSEPQSPRIQAHCSDCHAQDGRDLKYFNFSNHSIITRSRFHGLSNSQGEQIASYIRSLSFSNPGRPWNPPYQPGPGLDEQPVSNWAAGAGINWVLNTDADALPYLVNAGSGIVLAHGVDTRQVTTAITSDLFRPDGNLNPRQIPIALQLPDWNQWLPRIYPKDAWGPAFMQSDFGRFYKSTDPNGKSSIRALLRTANTGDSHLRNLPAAFEQWSRARRSFLKRFTKSGTAWSSNLTNKVYSTQLWQLVKTWELSQEFSLENRSRSLYGPVADARSWLNRVPGDTAPSAAHIPNGPSGVGGSALTNAYFNAAWYELQILLNSGNHQHRNRGPVDWVYVVGRFHDLYTQTRQPEPVRLMVAVIKAQQSSDPRLGPGTSDRGWEPDHNVDPRIMIDPAWEPLLKPLPRDVHRALTTAFLTAWMAKNQQYSIANYLPVGVRTELYLYQNYSEITGGEVWKSASEFKNAGVPADIIERLLDWGSLYTDRAARVQYEGHHPGKM